MYMLNGNYEEAEKHFRRYYSLSPDKITLRQYDDLHMFAYTLIKNGKEQEATLKLNQIKDHLLSIIDAKRPFGQGVGYEMGKIYALLGEKEEALGWLLDYEENGFGAGLHDFAKYDPPFESIRDDPEFQAILKRESARIAKERENITRLKKEGLL